MNIKYVNVVAELVVLTTLCMTTFTSLADSAVKKSCEGDFGASQQDQTVGSGYFFRDSDSRIQKADFVTRVNPNFSRVVDSMGNSKVLSDSALFRQMPLARAFTPRFQYWFNGSRFELTELVVANLNQGGRLLRESIARGDSFERQLRTAGDYVNSQLSYNECVALNPPTTFDAVLVGRRAGCVHFSLLTAAILSEAGFDLELVTGQADVGYGHIWLEVYLSKADGASLTYVVDTSGATYVSTFADAIREALRSRTSRAAEFYTSGSRRYYEVQ